jgi:aspartate-semialdehyde dehydrogenase
MVGRNFLKILSERDFPISQLYLFASARSAGSALEYRGKEYIVEELKEDSFDRGIDIALFSAGGGTSKKFAPFAAAKNCVVIDNSSAWRMDDNVPLVVPEVNPQEIKKHKGIIANPNCSTIQAVVALYPLHKAYGIKRIVYSTYQAVSGAGMSGVCDLENTLNGKEPTKFPKIIAGNCIPHIDVFLENGYTKEEEKMINETRKIMNAPNIKITATCVRVPVYVGHSESINIEFLNPFELNKVRDILSRAPGVIVADDPKQNVYPCPIDAAGTDEVYVGRVRRDESIPNGLNLWVVADNARKGAASNAVQIAELL